MRRYFFILAGLFVLSVSVFFLISDYRKSDQNRHVLSALSKTTQEKKEEQINIKEASAQAWQLLHQRKDFAALEIFEQILLREPDNLDALWAKAEIRRRHDQYAEAEVLLKQVLERHPQYNPALISLAYIRYYYDDLEGARDLIDIVLNSSNCKKEDLALAYLMLGAINSRRSEKGNFLDKIIYGTKIKRHLLKARQLGEGLAEVHLGLGTFYLLAPSICGGDLKKAIEELELAVKIAPDFATANARLAQAYHLQGDIEKSHFYINRAKSLEPDNRFVCEIESMFGAVNK